jgi:hypothetical protein
MSVDEIREIKNAINFIFKKLLKLPDNDGDNNGDNSFCKYEDMDYLSRKKVKELINNGEYSELIKKLETVCWFKACSSCCQLEKDCDCNEYCRSIENIYGIPDFYKKNIDEEKTIKLTKTQIDQLKSILGNDFGN